MTKSKRLALGSILLAAALIVGGCGNTRLAGEGDTVRVHYTGTLADGTEFDSSRDLAPLEFTLGAGQMIPGFEEAAYGMKVGEKKTVTIPAAEAYGEYRENLVMVMDRAELPEGVDYQPDATMVVSFKDGSVRQARITDVTDTTVTFDANHRLAGEDLTFEIEMVSIR